MTIEEVLDQIATHANDEGECDMQVGPFDFAWCNNHDEVFPLGGTCSCGESRDERLKLVAALRAVLVVNTGNNRELYGTDFEAGMAKALWLVRQTVEENLL